MIIRWYQRQFCKSVTKWHDIDAREIDECLLQRNVVVDDDVEVSTVSDDGEHALQRSNDDNSQVFAINIQQKIEHKISNFIVILKHEI